MEHTTQQTIEDMQQKLRKKHPTWSYEKRQWMILQALGQLPPRKW